MQNEQNQDHYGRCYCGAVRFLILAGTAPVFAGYCHCRDCRQAHASPIYQYVYVESDRFQIIEGSEHLRWYTRSEAVRDSFKRFFCANCGTRVYNDMLRKTNNEEVELCGTFPSLFDDPEMAANGVWVPRKHVHCAESILNLSLLHDDLPRYQ